jgi:rsbT antagonist protein RsbS
MESTIQKLENLLLVSVPRDLMDTEVLQLRRQVLREIRQHHSRWVLLDFSRVDICDSFFGRFIQGMAEMAGLMGAEVIVSGLQDAVVETMVDLGMTLTNVQAVLDLDDALALSRTSSTGQQDLDERDSASGEPALAPDVAFYAEWDEGLGQVTGETMDLNASDFDSLLADSPIADLTEV